jgi:site-specific DNA-methyltransferase (adenine-specific)/modification methylase
MRELNKIYNEDCLITMSNMDKDLIDIVITSPPYNTSRKGSSLNKACANIRYDDFNDCKTDDEYIEWTINVFKLYDKILKKDGVILYNLSYSSENTHLVWLVLAEIMKQTNFLIADNIIWKKPSTSPNSCSHNKLTRICEYVFVFCRKDEFDTFKCNKEISSYRKTGQASYKNYFNFIEAKNNDGPNEIHKATFSSELVRKLLFLYAKENDVIYDSFMGTGTTAIGCILEKMNYIGSEISNRYVKISNDRIDFYKNQKRLF